MRRPLPPIPASVPHLLGPIPVLIVADLKDENGGDVFGLWDHFARTISIREGMDPTAAWLTLYHEKTHAELAELGIAISTDQEEAICNWLALQRVHEMLVTTG